MGNAKGEGKLGDLNDFTNQCGYSNSPIPIAMNVLPVVARNLNYVALGMDAFYDGHE